MNVVNLRAAQMTFHLREPQALYFARKIEAVCTEPDHFIRRIKHIIRQAVQHKGRKNALIGLVCLIDIHNLLLELVIDELPLDVCPARVDTTIMSDLIDCQSKINIIIK